MNVVPMLEQREPHSVEAEQQVIGAILNNNDLADRVGALSSDDFYDPVHAMLYRTARRMISDGRVADVVTIAAIVGADEGLAELGGSAYLARLAGGAISSHAIKDYASMIVEARERRQLLGYISEAHASLVRGDSAPGDVAGALEASLRAVDMRSSRVAPVSMMSAVTSAVEQIHDAYHGKEIVGVSPVTKSLSRLVPAFRPGELWLLGGRPSMGKSAVALCIATEAARCGHPVAIASLEMRPEALAMRAISEASGRYEATNYHNMETGNLTENQMRATAQSAQDIADLPIMFLPREYQQTELLYVGVKQSLSRMGLDRCPLIVVDYAQLMRGKGTSRVEQITDVSLTLKDMAMRLGAPVLALSQLSRAVENRDNKRPQLSDLRESGQLEQDADGVMFCYRDEYYIEREEPDTSTEAHSVWMDAVSKARGKLEINVAKQRQGAIGTAHLRFNPATNMIWEL